MYSLILRQCTKLLQYKMEQDTAWDTTSNSNNPLVLLQLLEKITLAQIEDQYPFSTVYDQELTFYKFHKGSIPDPQWYESFNTNFDVSKTIGVTLHHKALLYYVAQDAH